MKHHLEKLWADERGATSIEYALIAGIVSVGILASLLPIRDALNSFFTTLSSSF